MTAGEPPAAAGGDRAPRTALVHDWLTGMRGGEKVLEEIARLVPRAPIYTLFHFPGSVSRQLESHPVRTSYLQRLPAMRKHYRKALPLFPAAIESFDLSAYDLVLSTSHCVAKGVIPNPSAFHLCYCHTPMRYAYDQEHAYFPQRHGPVAWLRSLALSRLRTWDAASAVRVDQFVANSRFVAGRIQRHYGRGAQVLHPPVDTDFFTPGPGAPGTYAVLVSALAPYKRVDLAVEACARAGIELHVVGDGPERERLERLRFEGVRFHGHVEVERLRELLRGAALFLQPGVEDFGISSVEALACGCPIVALGRGGILDIVRDGTDGLLYTGEGDSRALAAAIDKAREMGFNRLNLRQRAELFSTSRFRQGLRTLLSSSVPGLEEALS